MTEADLTVEDLNPRLREELNRIKDNLEEVEVTLVHPQQSSTTSTPTSEDYPSMQEMESHVTCRDVTEWNNSLHLKVLFVNDKVSLWLAMAPQ